jgi:CheY-like chemotaxis protein
MKVLIVDDDADIRSVARMCLQRIGLMEVTEAGSGSEGVRKARDEAFDVILLDIMMPAMDGPATLAQLRAHPGTAAVPVIFLTAKVFGTEIERLMKLGAAGVLIKPFDPRTLADDVRTLVKATA